ncbi:MAG: lysine--tRNA ligase [Candidatus Brocadiales bacterium]|nr:lysine--tRNA ligase [Candidatus Brocadiales bacterium]MBL7051143.1 lysine--tRNA ligase [Candidatus Woesearchaeota archaeon]
MEAIHWADQIVRRVIHDKGDKNSYTVAAGITPSGVVHIGNFREIMTVDLIARAFKHAKKRARFIYSWDDYDVFRKVPKGMPKPDMLKKHLRKPIIDIPDPFETESSYARHHELDVEQDVAKVGIFPEYIYQAKKYRKGDYIKEIKIALKSTDKIKEILNEFRKEPLPKDWLPITGFCPECGKDNLKFSNYDNKDTLKMDCKDCNTTININLNKADFLKLPWRIDWPMRWAYEEVDFEPGGKDHSTTGGSFSTAKEIVKLFKGTAPSYLMYNFISIKGAGGKISSSLGNVITLRDCLEIYEPMIVRWLFAGTRPGSEFAISFDLDVLKLYEDFDKCERIYYKKQEAKNDKEFAQQKRIYELSAINKPLKKISIQPSFRHLTNIVQIYNNDLKKIINYYNPQSKEDKEKITTRANCAINWLKKYAPEDMKFKLQENPSKKIISQLKENEKQALIKLSNSLKNKKFDEKSLFEEFYNISKSLELESKEFFQVAYKILINKQKGPKLAPFILEIGKEKTIDILNTLKQ